MNRFTVTIFLGAILMISLFGCGRNSAENRFAEVGRAVASPSGEFSVALIEIHREGNSGDPMEAFVVINDKEDEEVFRSAMEYSLTRGVGPIWLSTGNQLWILSSDVGPSYVEQNSEGEWVQTWIKPETRGDIPEEIAPYVRN